MRKSDKIKNIKKANLLTEQRFLKDSSLNRTGENNIIEEGKYIGYEEYQSLGKEAKNANAVNIFKLESNDGQKWFGEHEGKYAYITSMIDNKVNGVNLVQQGSDGFLMTDNRVDLSNNPPINKLQLVATVSNADNPVMIQDPKTKKLEKNPNYKENIPSKIVKRY